MVSPGRPPLNADPDGEPRTATPGSAGSVEAISRQLDELNTLDSRPLAEHADVYHRIHAELQAALVDIDGH